MTEVSTAQVANAREEEEHEVSIESEAKTEVARTAADFIEEAAKYVNWKPDPKYPQQARYDALRALNGIHAYFAAVTLETLRRIDPAAAERVAAHFDRDQWDINAENAGAWHETLASGQPIADDDHVFQKLTGTECNCGTPVRCPIHLCCDDPRCGGNQ